MVGSDRECGVVLQAADNIQVRHTRLDHEHIGTFSGIQSSLDKSLATVGRILLVSLLISEARVAVQGITEGTVVRGGIFGSVRQDGDISESFRIQSIANGLDTSVLRLTEQG